MMHEGPRHINVVESVIANAISQAPDVSQGLDAKDAEDISSLYLEVEISLSTSICCCILYSGHGQYSMKW